MTSFETLVLQTGNFSLLPVPVSRLLAKSLCRGKPLREPPICEPPISYATTHIPSGVNCVASIGQKTKKERELGTPKYFI